MTGEEAITLARYHAQDAGIATYIELNRALREYCQATGFSWLRQVEGAAIVFTAGDVEYALADIALRRIERVWTQHPDSLKWSALDETDLLGYERRVAENRDEEGNDDTRQPTHFLLAGSVLRIGPTPDQSDAGRFDGLVETPVIERNQELPGPREYHEIVPILAAGYEVQAEARRRIAAATDESGIIVARELMSVGRDLEGRARAKFPAAMRDATPNRLQTLQWPKTPLMR